MSELVEAAKPVHLEYVSILKWLGLLTACYMLYFLILRPFLLSPVRHIPGPYWSRVSRLPLLYYTLKRRRSEYAANLIDQYGPIVVIAPDQIHTTDDAAMKTIYDKSAVKTPFYSAMGSWKGVKSTLGIISYAEAAPSRNNLLQCFQNRNLDILVGNIESHCDDFTKLLNARAAANEAVDGVIIFRFFALDVVTDVLWGEKNRLLAEVDDGEAAMFLRRFQAFSTWNALKSFIPGADTFVRYFGNKRWKTLRKDCNDMDVTAHEAIKRWQTDEKSSEREKDVLSMLQTMGKNGASGIKTEEIPAYMVEMLAAGSSTTSHTACFAAWLLTRDSKAQSRLHEELKAAWPDLNSYEIKKCLDLPYLDGVIRETMRLYPMIPGPLERYLGKDLTIAGHQVKAGVVASTAAYNQGRLEEVYANHEKWTPERWIDASDAMKLNWIPFGHGCRACPGANLAMTELKYLIATIFRRFEAVIPPGYEDDTLELADVFAAGTRSGQCWLKFVSKD